MDKLSIWICGAFIAILTSWNVHAEYSGPNLKIPMERGLGSVMCTTGVGDSAYHSGNSYYSLDFNDRYDGDRVLAAAAGVIEQVVNSGCSNGGATCLVVIRHSNNYTTRYLHLKNGSSLVSVNDYVIQGQIIGEIGNTGVSSGSHLHFELKHSGNGSASNSMLYGVTLDDVLFTSYEAGSDYNTSSNYSTDNFTYAINSDHGNTCYGSILGGEEFNWIYWCNTIADVFEQGYIVKSLIEINDINEEFRFKVEVWDVNASSASLNWEYTSWWSDPGNWIWDRSYFTPEFRDAPAGNWEFRIFVDTVNDGADDFIHIDTLPFTVESKNFYYDHHSYRGRNWSNEVYDYKGYTCYGPVTGGASTNWEYTCNGFEHGKTPIQSTFFTGDRVYTLVEINDIRSDFRMKSEIYHKDLYGTETLKYVDIGWLQNVEWLWDRAYYFPYIDTDAPGEWRFEIYIDAGYGYEWIDTINFVVHDSLIESYQYKRNGITCRGPITGGISTNWIYTCENEATIFKEGSFIQAMLHTTNVSVDHSYKVEAYKDGSYQWDWVHGPIEVEPYIWGTSYFTPTLSNASIGDWEFRISIDVGLGFEQIDMIKFSVI